MTSPSAPTTSQLGHNKTSSSLFLDVVLDTTRIRFNENTIQKKQTNNSQLKPPQHQEENIETETYLFPDCKTLKAICSKCTQSYNTVRLKGYEIYIVEQWACERRLSSVILSYTGNSQHQVEVLSVKLLKDRDSLSDSFKSMFKEIEDSGARATETESGILHITNLSSFPSNLNLLLVPNGSSLTVWEYFKVNVNLRRMNCLGRSALILSPPTDATEDKFRQIYRIDPKVDIMYAVEELVTLVQIALVDFKLHDPHYVDGLLCDMTERNIQKWWNNFGSYCFMQPKDGIIGPSTVSALIGFILSCSFRLDIAGSDFPKEPFNYVNFRVNVGKFQKQYNLEQTWYLDTITVEKLFKVTSKIPTSDISKLKKVVKTRVNDISRRANHNVSASEVLATDLEKTMKFFHYSARLDYLWYGKGDVRDLKKFDYRFDEDLPLSNSYSLRSSVGKIRKIPKKLNDEYNPAVSRKLRKSRLSKIQNETEVYPLETIPSLCEKSSEVCIESSSLASITLPATDPNVSSNPECVSASEEFTRNLHRRSSFPFTPEELNIPQLKYENHTTPLNIYPPTIRLKRSKSFSVVELSLLRYETISPTPTKLIQILKSINLKLHTQSETQIQYMKLKSEYEDSMNHIAARSLKLSLRTKPLFYNADIQFQANERLNFKLEDMEHLASRLEYEMRVLGNTVRDTRDGIEVFIGKMDVLENLLDERCKEGDCDTDWFGWIWRSQTWKKIQRNSSILLESLGASKEIKDDKTKLGRFDDITATEEALLLDDSDSSNSSDNNSNDESQELKVNNEELLVLEENPKEKKPGNKHEKRVPHATTH